MFSIGWKIILIIVVIAGVVTVGRIVLFPLWFANKAMDTVTGVIDRTLDPDNAIQNYEWFKQMYEDIQATDNKIVNAEMTTEQFKEDAGPRENWGFEDKNEHSRLNTVVLGLRNHRESMVAQYNARSRMVNRKIFKMFDTILPEKLE